MLALIARWIPGGMFGSAWRFVGAAVVLAVALAGLFGGIARADEAMSWTASDMEAASWDADEFVTVDGEYSLSYSSGASFGRGACFAVGVAGDYTATFHVEAPEVAAVVGVEYFDDGSCSDNVGSTSTDVGAAASWSDVASGPFTLDAGWSVLLRYQVPGGGGPVWIASASLDVSPAPTDVPSPTPSPVPSDSPSPAPSGTPGATPTPSASAVTVISCPMDAPCVVTFDAASADLINGGTFAVLAVGAITVFCLGALVIAAVRR